MKSSFPKHGLRRIAVASGLALILQAAALVPVGASPGGTDAAATRNEVAKKKPKKDKGTDLCLTLLHNNDAESALLNAGSGDLENFGGAARFKTLHDALVEGANVGKPDKGTFCGGKKYRDEGRNGVLTVSSGDNFLPGPVFDASLDKGVPFFDAIAMELIGYDAVAIGNHDFDFGPDNLADFIESFGDDTPFLSSNLNFDQEARLNALEETERIAKSVVVREQKRKVGIIGATTTLLPFISSPGDVEVDTAVAEAIQAEVKKLQKKQVKIIILISHLNTIDEDLALAPELKGIDLMVAGGGDEILANADDVLLPGDEPADIDGDGTPDGYPVFATDANGKQVPVVTTAGGYRYVGNLRVAFNKKGKVIAIDEPVSGPVRVAGGGEPDAVAEDPTVLEQVTNPVAAHVAELQANVVGTTEVALDGVRTSVRTMETNEGNLIADAMLAAATSDATAEGDPLPDIAIQNAGGIRNDSIIGPGNITEFDTFSMLPFSNFVAVVQDVEPEQLKAALENAVSRVENVDGRFAQISGFEFTYDPAGDPRTYDDEGNVLTEGSRVVDVTLGDGTPIVVGGVVVPLAPSVNVATINFLANGGDQYPFSPETDTFITYGTTYQQSLVNFLTVDLGGTVTAADYPEGGEGRVTPI